MSDIIQMIANWLYRSTIGPAASPIVKPILQLATLVFIALGVMHWLLGWR